MSKYLQCMVNCSQNGLNVTGRTEDDLPRGPRMGWFFMVKFQKWLGKSAHEWSQTGWFSYNGQDECGWDTKVDPWFVDSCWFRWKVTPMVVGLYHIMFLLPSISGSSEFILDYLCLSSWIHLKLDIHLTINTINTIHLVSFPAQMAIVTVRRPLGIPTFWALQTAGIAPTSIATAEQCHDDLPRHRAWT